jgi:hypothetical protein
MPSDASNQIWAVLPAPDLKRRHSGLLPSDNQKRRVDSVPLKRYQGNNNITLVDSAALERGFDCLELVMNGR